jgi:hypothetical protein
VARRALRRARGATRRLNRLGARGAWHASGGDARASAGCWGLRWVACAAPIKRRAGGGAHRQRNQHVLGHRHLHARQRLRASAGRHRRRGSLGGCRSSLGGRGRRSSPPDSRLGRRGRGRSSGGRRLAPRRRLHVSSRDAAGQAAAAHGVNVNLQLLGQLAGIGGHEHLAVRARGRSRRRSRGGRRRRRRRRRARRGGRRRRRRGSRSRSGRRRGRRRGSRSGGRGPASLGLGRRDLLLRLRDVGDRRAHGSHGAVRHGDHSQPACEERLDVHVRLVRLDDHHGVALGHLVALALQPRHDLALSHRAAQRRHENLLDGAASHRAARADRRARPRRRAQRRSRAAEARRALSAQHRGHPEREKV